MNAQWPDALAALVPAERSSAPVTQVAERAWLTVGVVLVIALAIWGMRAGWLGRAKRQASLPAPSVQADDWDPTLVEGVQGRYPGSTSSGAWLDRIVAHGLGTPSRAVAGVGVDGVLFVREGAKDLFIPSRDLRGARLDRGIAGDVVEPGGFVVITWCLGDACIDTGFRADEVESNVALLEAIRSLIAPETTASPCTCTNTPQGKR